MWGSCFVENIGKLLTQYKFSCDMNPFGILYNPMSIAKAIDTLIQGKTYTRDNLKFYNGLWYSMMHHSSFSSPIQEECLDRINRRITEGIKNIREANWIIITFGTARVYKWEGEVVGNCHKLPAKQFSRELLTVEEIYTEYGRLAERLRSINPDVKFLFTVSPIRHAKDGMHGNQLNKSTLLLAIDRICQSTQQCFYFPSYEIMMDELRDYRFYNDDMLHPSPLAVNYIWQQLTASCFETETIQFMKEWDTIEKGLNHRPFNPESDSYRRFVSQILLKIEVMKEKFPYLDIKNEIKICQALLKK